ncbi:MAG: ribbon-helix-helix protein, CopG family [Candidatus Handelsmanbacteria bacterium]|nr:ribbon-helix-helix protein, CopG family [Candidatus Handelsmanbacteria bacterium]
MPRVNIMLPDEILEQMDQVAQREGLNRSQLIRQAFLVYLERRGEDDQRQQRQADIQKAMELQDRLRQRPPPWDALRTLREQRKGT